MGSDSVSDVNAVSKALELINFGALCEEVSIKVGTGKGRPKKFYKFSAEGREVLLTRPQFDLLEQMKLAAEQSKHIPKSMTESEFSEMCRLAVPQLMDRAIRIAMMSDDAKEVMAVAKEITDRGYGKITKVHDHESQETDYLRRSWREFPEYNNFNVIEVDDNK